MNSVTNKIICKLFNDYFSTLSTDFIVVFNFFYFLKKERYNKISVKNVDKEFFTIFASCLNILL